VKVLVTGAAGFLGSEVLREALAGGIEPVALVLSGERLPSDLCGKVRQVTGDIRNRHSLTQSVIGCDAVCHCAGLAHVFKRDASPSAFEEINSRGAENVFRAALDAGVRQFVQVSTVAVYGAHNASLITEDHVCQPETSYAISKYRAEKVLRELAEQSGSQLVILRMATIIGEEDPGNVGRMIRAFDRARIVAIPCGSTQKSFVHKRDAARACRAGLEYRGSTVQVVNISCLPAPLREVTELIGARLTRPRLRIPAWCLASGGGFLRRLAKCSAAARAAERTISRLMSDEQFSSDRARAVLGWSPVMDWRAALEAELGWYLTRVRS
jgi:UDP-glucose 4-epimerase